ncbi:MAG: hypothetical protein WBN22_13360 [Verrucomicrobiia bacterium]
MSIFTAIGFLVAFLLAVYALLFLMQMSRRAVARQKGSRQILEYGWLFRALGCFIIVVGVAALYGASRSAPDQRLFAWIVAGFFAVVGIYFGLQLLLFRIEFDDSFIYTSSPWRKRQQIPWADITSCQFSKADRCLLITTQTHGKVRVPVFMSGIRSFAEKVQEKGYA